jgi:hypothetical protein
MSLSKTLSVGGLQRKFAQLPHQVIKITKLALGRKASQVWLASLTTLMCFHNK